MKFKKLVLGLILFAATLMLTACTNAAKPSNSTGSSASDPQLQAIKSSGKLVVAISPDYPPFEYQTLVNGKNTIVGADVDLAKAIAKQLGVTLDLSSMSFDNTLTAVAAGKADIAISGISATAKRQLSFDFSDVYYTDPNDLVIKKSDLSKYDSLSSFKGVELAAQTGSIQEDVVKNQIPDAKLISLQNTADQITEVKTSKVAGTVLEDMIAKSYVSANPDLAIANITIPKAPDQAGMAVAMKLGSKGLKSEINSVISQLKSSDQMQNIIDKNFKASQAK